MGLNYITNFMKYTKEHGESKIAKIDRNAEFNVYPNGV